MKRYVFNCVKYIWGMNVVKVNAYDIKQARKLAKKCVADSLSRPQLNSVIKVKNVKIKLLKVEK